MLKKYLEVGQVVGTHGINGELRVQPWCDSPDFLTSFKTLYMGKELKKISIRSRAHKNIALVKIQGIDDVRQADLLRGKVLFMDRDDAHLEKGTYFVQDIIGLKVLDFSSGVEYGIVTDVLKTGANDVYQITDSKSKDYFLPVIDEVVKEKSPENGYIKIYPMKGIFDDED